jgi:hypothetical protein
MSTIITGYWQAALTVGFLIRSSGYLIGGLEQKLLAGGTQKDVDKSFSLTTIFSIPMLFGAIALSGDILWIIKPSYSSVWVAACFLAIDNFLTVLIRFHSTIMSGTDMFDLNENVTLKDYVRSRIFLNLKLYFIRNLMYLSSVTASLVTMSAVKADIVSVLAMMALSSLLSDVILLLTYRYYLKREMVSNYMKINLKKLTPNIIAALIMTIAVLAIRCIANPRAPRFIDSIQTLLGIVLFGAFIYFIALYKLSQDFRNIIRDIRTYISQRDGSTS